MVLHGKEMTPMAFDMCYITISIIHYNRTVIEVGPLLKREKFLFEGVRSCLSRDFRSHMCVIRPFCLFYFNNCF